MDIVERLNQRGAMLLSNPPKKDLYLEAADAIEKLRAENSQLIEENSKWSGLIEEKYDCACAFVSPDDECDWHSPHIQKLRVELAELKAANEWKPISEAP